MISSMNYITFPDPGLSIMEMHKKYNKLFWPKNDPWYKKEKFANEKSKKQKRTILSVPVSDSMGKTHDEQIKLLPEGDSVPSAREIVALMMWQYQKNEERLFEDVYVRTSDISSLGFRVFLGGFVGSGLNVGSFWVDYRLSYLGLASARKSANLDPRTLESSDISNLERRVESIEKWIQSF